MIDDSACIHMLYGLEGAIEEIRKSELAADKNAELKEFCKSLSISK